MADHSITSGFLPVGNGHELYFEEWGNQKADPMIYLHGGPGSSFSDANKLLFDPRRHHVLFFDQRGCGRSTPYASVAHNTTQDLVSDINKLADHLNFKKFTLVGGSWGSSLSLIYALHYPERIKQMVLWSIYLVRQFEMDYVNEGYARYAFPEAWERFVSLVPKEERRTGDQILQYYAQKIQSDDQEEAKKYADEWTLWEFSLVSKYYDKDAVEATVLGGENTALARLETYYFTNKCFIPENFIIDNIQKIQHIPCHVVHGRLDQCTPAKGAYDLKKAYGEKLILQWTNGGHSRSGVENFAAIKAIINTLA